MKTSFALLSLASTIAISALFVGCTDSSPSSPAYENNDAQMLASTSELAAQIAAIAADSISSEEQAGMLLMREEEKLARDVYTALYQRWGHRAFNNIARSESTHMSALLLLLNRYSIPDPVSTNGPGKFTNPHLQELYNQLIDRGGRSLEEALRVGVLIEETDIHDLEKSIATADNRDILLVYNNLLRGSQNHLRAFTRGLGIY